RRESIAAYLVTQLGKYMPGKVWPAVMQTFYVGSGKEIGRIAWANIELFLITAIHMVSLGAACMLHGTSAWPLALAAGLMASFLITIGRSHRFFTPLFRRFE